MIVTIELESGETLPLHFPHWILGSGSHYEKRHGEPVPPMTLRLVREGKTYRLEGGFWIDATVKP